MDNSRIASLEARLRDLEDREALRHLKARYARYCDLKYRPSPKPRAQHLDETAGLIAGLFCEDAVWDGGERFGRTEGRAQIRERFSRETFRFAIHYFLLPELSISGDHASGTWYLLQPATSGDGRAIWIAGIEHDEYRRENGVWLISRMSLDLSFMAPHDQGWASHDPIG